LYYTIIQDLKNLIKIAFIFSLLLFVSSCAKHEPLSLKKELVSEYGAKSGDVDSNPNDVEILITDPEIEEDKEVSITDPENEEDKEVN
jgi:hypothetical protein